MIQCIFLDGTKQGVMQTWPVIKERIYFAIPEPIRVSNLAEPPSLDAVSIQQIEYQATFISRDRECVLYTTTGRWDEIIRTGDWVVSPQERVSGRNQKIIFAEPVTPPLRVSIREKLNRIVAECKERRPDGAKYFAEELLEQLSEEYPNPPHPGQGKP